MEVGGNGGGDPVGTSSDSLSLSELQEDPTKAAPEKGTGFRCAESPEGWGTGDPV